MKRILILALVAGTLTANMVFAQSKLALGLALGGSFNIHTGSSLQKTGTGTGFIGGGQADWSFSKSFAVLTTVYGYDNRIGGYTYDLSLDGIDYTANVSTTIAYAGVEPLLKFSFPDDRFYLVVGPSIEFKVEGQSEVTTTINTPGYSFSNGYASGTTTNDLTDINIRFGLTFGGGYVFKLDRDSRLTAQLSFDYGLNNIEKNVDWRIASVRLIGALEFDIVQ